MAIMLLDELKKMDRDLIVKNKNIHTHGINHQKMKPMGMIYKPAKTHN